MDKIIVKNIDFYYGKFHALIDVSLAIQERSITSIIGPSGCGKSTLLRVFNRMNDLVEGARLTGKVLIDGQDVYGPTMDLRSLRKKVGMVFQRPNPFPLSVFENVAYGPNVHQLVRGSQLRDRVEMSLSAVGLWEDLKDKLRVPALSLSGEQQQRLCIARLVAVEPEILLMDEPCSSLDPIATQHIEELMFKLKERYTIVIVTHNMQQAARVSNQTAYMLLGKLIEYNTTKSIFTNPAKRETEEYIRGLFG
jgi:phosphate transport system ATP-binding protein